MDKEREVSFRCFRWFFRVIIMLEERDEIILLRREVASELRSKKTDIALSPLTTSHPSVRGVGVFILLRPSIGKFRDLRTQGLSYGSLMNKYILQNGIIILD